MRGFPGDLKGFQVAPGGFWDASDVSGAFQGVLGAFWRGFRGVR